MDDLDKRVTVAVRVRPKITSATNATQTAELYHPETVVKLSDVTLRVADAATITGAETGAPQPQSANNNNTNSLGGSNKPRVNTFNFDYIFDKDSPQLEVYEEVALDAVDAALQSGSNASILTYGQTGSGKTHTILGAVGKNPLSDDVITPNTGIFLRVLRDILSFAESQRKTRHVVVVLSVTEVYLDLVKDLLQGTPNAVVVGSSLAIDGATTTATNKPTKESAQLGGVVKVIIDGEAVRIPELAHHRIENLRDAVNAYTIATSRRVIRATDANDSSSRSHALFTVDIFQQRRSEDLNPDPLPVEAYLALRDCYGNAASPAATTPASQTTSSGTNQASSGSTANLSRKPSAASLAAPKKPSTSTGLDLPQPSSPTTAAIDPLLFTPPIGVGKASNPVIKVTPKTLQTALLQAMAANPNTLSTPSSAGPTARGGTATRGVGGGTANTSSPSTTPSTTTTGGTIATPLAAALGVTAPLPPIVFSRLVLTDLAGSEKLKHSGATDKGFEEMKKINASLTALGNVVHALFEGSSHVPYRDAKLTVLLRSSFATPHSKIVLIANCAPTSLTFDETMSTIFFADKVKVMKVDGAGMNAAASAAAAQAIRQEAEFLRVAKLQEELTADLRVLKGGFGGYRPLIRQCLASSTSASDELYSTVVQARLAKASASKEGKLAFQQQLLERDNGPLQVAQNAADAFRAEEVSEIDKAAMQVRTQVMENQVTSYKQRRTTLETELANNERTAAENIQELDDEAARLVKEIDLCEAHLKSSESDVAVLTRSKVETLLPSIKECVSREATITADLQVVELAFAEKYRDEQEEWERETSLQALRDDVFARIREFFKRRLEMGLHRLLYIGDIPAAEDESHTAPSEVEEGKKVNAILTYIERTWKAGGLGGAPPVNGGASLLHTEWLRREARFWERESEIFEIRYWVHEAVCVMARNAVTRALKNAKRSGGVMALAAPLTRPQHRDPNALVATADGVSASSSAHQQQLLTNPSYDRAGSPSSPYPVARPPPRMQMLVDPTASNPYASLRPSTTFDNPALVRQIHGYMIGGCSLLKQTRKGTPHFRFYALHIDESKSQLRLYWGPEDVVNNVEGTSPAAALVASTKTNYLDLFSVTKVVIGRCCSGASPEEVGAEGGGDHAAAVVVPELALEEDFYKSFTVHFYSGSNATDGSVKTMEITAETVAEMEAWVIGICSLARCNPQFDARILHKHSWVSVLGPETPVDPIVAETAARWHICPRVWTETESQIRALGTKLAVTRAAVSALKPTQSKGGDLRRQSSSSSMGGAAIPAAASAPPSTRPTPLGNAIKPPPATRPLVPPGASMTPTPAAVGAVQTTGDASCPPPQRPLFCPAVVTPGMLRQIMQIDVFRATAAWYLFVRLGLLASVPSDDTSGLPLTYLEFDDDDRLVKTKKQRAP